jgi:glycosyltransferase involved in cell wall biosynthesis
MVTVVMPAHNAEHTLGWAISSVLAQTLTDWQLVIADDGSTDQTFPIATAAAQLDSRITVVRLAQQQGPAVARNTVLAQATGRFLAFLDADDLWLPHKLEHQLAFHQAHGALLSGTAYWRVNANWQGGISRWLAQPPHQTSLIPIPEKLDYSSMTWHNGIGCGTALFDRLAAPTARMPNLPGAEDWGLWLALLRCGRLAYGLAEPLTVYRAGGSTAMTAHPLRLVKAAFRLLHEVEGFSAAGALRRVVRHSLTTTRRRDLAQLSPAAN